MALLSRFAVVKLGTHALRHDLFGGRNRGFAVSSVMECATNRRHAPRGRTRYCRLRRYSMLPGRPRNHWGCCIACQTSRLSSRAPNQSSTVFGPPLAPEPHRIVEAAKRRKQVAPRPYKYQLRGRIWLSFAWTMISFKEYRWQIL